MAELLVCDRCGLRAASPERLAAVRAEVELLATALRANYGRYVLDRHVEAPIALLEVPK